jgi:hypothetical protein
LLPQHAAHEQVMDSATFMTAMFTTRNWIAPMPLRTASIGMMSDHADRHQAAVFRQADMHEAEQDRQFQGQQSDADRAAQAENAKLKNLVPA